MPHLRDGDRFTAETAFGCEQRRDAVEHLERDRAIEVRLERAVNGAHGAAADYGLDLERAYTFAGFDDHLDSSKSASQCERSLPMQHGKALQMARAMTRACRS
jgi:hypothetical protein